MAKHKVSFNVPNRPLSHADVIFSVREDGGKFGELRISQGALVWFPKNKHIGYRLSWLIHNSRKNQLSNERSISAEHITNNRAVRQTLLGRGIRPEQLSPAEDLKKVERRLAAVDKKVAKKPDTLGTEGDNE